MSQNNIEELREHLFSTLRDLKNREHPMEIDRAKAICEVSQTIINTAKVEIEHAKVTGTETGSNFLSLPEKPGVTTHRIRG